MRVLRSIGLLLLCFLLCSCGAVDPAEPSEASSAGASSEQVSSAIAELPSDGTSGEGDLSSAKTSDDAQPSELPSEASSDAASDDAVRFDNPQVIVTTTIEGDEEAVPTGTIHTTLTLPTVAMPQNKAAAEKINSALLALYEKAVAYRDDLAKTLRIEELSSDSAYYQFTLQPQSIYLSGRLLSLQFSRGDYFGMRGDRDSSFTHNFDIVTGKAMTLEDVLDPAAADAKSALKSLLCEALAEEMPWEDDVEPIADKIISELFSDASKEWGSHWSFDHDGMKIEYIQVENIGKVVQGNIPYAQLSGIINAEYLPREQMPITDGLLTARTPSAADGYENRYGEASSFGITADGIVVDACVSSEWGYAFFYANYLTADDWAWIPDSGEESYGIYEIRKDDADAPPTLRAAEITFVDGVIKTDEYE